MIVSFRVRVNIRFPKALRRVPVVYILNSAPGHFLPDERGQPDSTEPPELSHCRFSLRKIHFLHPTHAGHVRIFTSFCHSTKKPFYENLNKS